MVKRIAFLNFHGAKTKRLHRVYKQPNFVLTNNRNGGIINIVFKNDKLSEHFCYLMNQRFRGQDYRAAVPLINCWIDDELMNNSVAL